MYTYEQRMTAVNLYIKYIIKPLQSSENWDILIVMYSSSGSKNMKPLGICIKAVSYARNQNS